MLLTGTFKTIRKQPVNEGHPIDVFLRNLPPQDTPQDFSHEHQMAFKTHPDRKKNLNAAYWRFHENAKTPWTFTAIVGKLAFIFTRMYFGTTSAPAGYTTTSEAEIDPWNDLLIDAP